MITYRKVGGLRFLRIGPFGLVWFWSAKSAKPRVPEDVVVAL